MCHEVGDYLDSRRGNALGRDWLKKKNKGKLAKVKRRTVVGTSELAYMWDEVPAQPPCDACPRCAGQDGGIGDGTTLEPAQILPGPH